MGRFWDHTPDPNSALMKELGKMEACLEKALRAGGINRDFLAGRPVRIDYPFEHGLSCTGSWGEGE